MKRTFTLFLLLFLVISCTPTPTGPLPTATASPAGEALPTQAPTPPSTPTPEPTSTLLTGSGFTLKRIAQTGGRINGISVVADVAYVGMGPRVAAIDIRQPDQPQLIHQSEPLPGAVARLVHIEKEDASFLLVGAGRYLVLLDISHPGEFASVQQLALAGAISALVWDPQQGLLYVGGSIYHTPANYSGYISAVQLTPDNHLLLNDSTDMPERPLSLALSNEGLYAGAEGYQGGLYYIPLKGQGELSTPLLVIASTPIEPLQPLCMQVIGDRLYLSYMSIDAYDITNPNQPEKIWSVGGNVVQSFSLDGDQIYAFGWTILSAFVQSAVSVPEPVLGPPVGITSSVTAMHNGNFLVAFDNLEIYKPIQPEGLQLLGSFHAPVTNAIGISTNEALVFVVDRGVGFESTTGVLLVLNLPDLSLREYVALDNPTWNWFHGMALDNERIYLATSDSISVYTYSESDRALTKVGQVEISGGGVEGIAVLSNPMRRLLVVAQQTSESSLLKAYDLTDLDNPVLLGQPLMLEKGEIVQMIGRDSDLFAILRPAYQVDHVMLERISFEGNALKLHDSLLIPGYGIAMAVHDDMIAIAGSQDMSIISAKDAEPMLLLSQSALPEVGVGVSMYEDKVLVAVGDDHGAAELLAFNISNPALPRQDCALDIPVSQLNTVPMVLNGPYRVMANGYGGVEVLMSEP